MELCPICEIKKENDSNYCLNCAWEFEYFIDDISEKNKSTYFNKIKNRKKVYLKSLINKNEIKVKGDGFTPIRIFIFFIFFTIPNFFFIMLLNINESNEADIGPILLGFNFFLFFLAIFLLRQKSRKSDFIIKLALIINIILMLIGLMLLRHYDNSIYYNDGGGVVYFYCSSYISPEEYKSFSNYRFMIIFFIIVSFPSLYLLLMRKK